MSRSKAVLLSLALLGGAPATLALPASASAAVDAPCVAATQNAPAIGAPPVVRIWHDGETAAPWNAPGCAEWTTGRYSTVVALSASFPFAGNSDDLLARFGAISQMAGMRYWSVGDSDWRTLVTKAVALRDGQSQQHRADFTRDEMRHAGDFYYSQNDSRSSSAVTYRMRVLEAGPDRVVVEMENTSSVKLLVLPIYRAGDIKSRIYLSRSGNGVWRFDELAAVHEGSFSPGG
ncbi:MAG: DUF6675 family protein, partial [Rhodospirillales bacterium]